MLRRLGDKLRALAQRTRRHMEPYGLIYGNRAFLVGRVIRGTDMRLWRLARMSAAEVTGESFTRDPSFDLARLARRSFGTFQEEPLGVVLRFGRECGGGCGRVRVPPRPDRGAERGWLVDGMFHRWRHRRDVLALGYFTFYLLLLGEALSPSSNRTRQRRRMTEMCDTLAAHDGAPP